MEGLVKLVYRDGSRGERSIVGRIVDEDHRVRVIERESDGRRFEINKDYIIKMEELQEE